MAIDLAASYAPDGKLNAIALELEANDHNMWRNLAKSIISVGAVAILAVAMAGLIPPSLLSGAGYVIATAGFGVASNLMFMSVDHIMNQIQGIPVNYSFNKKLKDMTGQSKFKELPHEQVFDLLLSAHPEIATKIEQEFGKKYQDLPLTNKTIVAKQYEDILHAKQLADMINRAELSPPELGFIAYGQREEIVAKKTLLDDNRHAVYTGSSDSVSHTEKLQNSRVNLSESFSQAVH